MIFPYWCKVVHTAHFQISLAFSESSLCRPSDEVNLLSPKLWVSGLPPSADYALHSMHAGSCFLLQPKPKSQSWGLIWKKHEHSWVGWGLEVNFLYSEMELWQRKGDHFSLLQLGYSVQAVLFLSFHCVVFKVEFKMLIRSRMLFWKFILGFGK